MAESAFAERSDGGEEKVSGAEVIAQALKTQVRRLCCRERLLRKPGGGGAVAADGENAGVGREVHPEASLLAPRGRGEGGRLLPCSCPPGCGVRVWHRGHPSDRNRRCGAEAGHQICGDEE